MKEIIQFDPENQSFYHSTPYWSFECDLKNTDDFGGCFDNLLANGDVISLLYDQGVLIEGEGQGDPDLVEGTLIVYEFVRENYYKGFIERFNKFLKEVEEGKHKDIFHVNGELEDNDEPLTLINASSK